MIKKVKPDEELGPDGNPKKKFTKKDRNMEDCFECKSIFVAFYSEKGCSLNVSCSFPNQDVKGYERDDDKIYNTSNKELTHKFKMEVDDQIEKMNNDL